MNTTELAAFSGFLFGLIGTSLGLLNYFRDKGRIVVWLQWDMAITGEDQNKRFGCIRVYNTGRRAVYVSHVTLRLPKGGERTHIVIPGGLNGQKISEGDQQLVFPFNQDDLEIYADRWQEIVGQVSDSTGRIWLSKAVKTVPSWAKNPLRNRSSTARALSRLLS